MALDSEGRQNFSDLRAGRGNLHYAAFDALWIEGKDLRPVLLTRREQLLTRLIPATTTVLSQVFSIDERGRDLFAAAERLDSQYRSPKAPNLPLLTVAHFGLAGDSTTEVCSSQQLGIQHPA